MINTKLETSDIINKDMYLFFDLDGTLIDTDLANFLSYKEAIRIVLKNNQVFKFDSENRFNRTQLLKKIPDLSRLDYTRIIELKEIIFDKYISKTFLIQSNEKIMRRFLKSNKIFIVSNCREKRCISLLNHYKILDCFSEIFFREFSDGSQKINKFQNAINKLGVNPSQVIVFENEAIEILDAEFAGVKFINPIII